MLREKVITLLKIRPEEMRMVTWMAALFLLVQAGQGFGDTVAYGLFVSKNADRLPYMYVPLGAIVFLVSLAYTASLGRFQNSSVVLSFLAGMMLLLLAEWAAIGLLKLPIVTQIFWLTVNGMGVVLGTLLWTAAGEVCDARQAKRLFPFFTSVGILGSVVGSYLSGALAKPLGSEHLYHMILAYALMLVGAFFILRNLTRVYFTPEQSVSTEVNLISDLRAGFDFVLDSGLFRLLALAAILFSVLFFAVDFPFSQIVATHYNHVDIDVTSFKGNFTSLLTLVTFVASLVIANRLYARIGIVNSILIMPVLYLLGLVTFYIFYGFQAAAAFRFTQQVVLGGVMGTAWSALFNVVPIERRGQVLAFMNGVPSQIGVILSGFLLIVGSKIFQGENQKQLLIMGAVVALFCCYVVWKMRAAYGNALVSALQNGHVEVFSNDEEAFVGYENDPAALEATFKALHDPRPAVRRLAAEMLASVGSLLAIPDLIERLSDEDTSVRIAALKALADLDAKGAASQIVLGLNDVDEAVREQALASLTKLEVAPSPELIHTLKALLNDVNIRVGARAAVVLLHLGDTEQAHAFLTKMLHDYDARTRSVALVAYQAIAQQTQACIPFDLNLIVEALNDQTPAVRRDALRVAAFFKEAIIINAVAAHLADVDVAVRRTASESLKQLWPESRSVLLAILTQKNDMAASAALDAIPVGDVDVLPPIRTYIQHEVAEINYVRTLIDSLSTNGRMIMLLLELLRYRITQIEERLVKAVGLFGNPRAMELVRKGLSGNVAARAAALEALETLGDKRITTEVLPILDRSGVFRADSGQFKSPNELVDIFLSNEDRWLRALSPHLIVDFGLEERVPEIRKLLSDQDILVKEAAQIAMTRLGGHITMRKLKTLSMLDRILLLREVPIFSGLSPEDLERIAEIAEEQLFLDKSYLCHEGEPGHTLFVIASGNVDVIKKVGDREQVLATRTNGQFVGEMAILEAAPRSATLRARGGVRTMVIDGEAFNAILLDRPQVAVSVLQNMSTRVRELNEKVSAAG